MYNYRSRIMRLDGILRRLLGYGGSCRLGEKHFCIVRSLRLECSTECMSAQEKEAKELRLYSESFRKPDLRLRLRVVRMAERLSTLHEVLGSGFCPSKTRYGYILSLQRVEPGGAEFHSHLWQNNYSKATKKMGGPRVDRSLGMRSEFKSPSPM